MCSDNPPPKLSSCNVAGSFSYPKIALFDLLTKSAKQYPKKTAIVYLEREISYAELAMLSDQFAVALADLGVKKGDCVAIFLPNIPQFIIVYYGILKAGAVVTTLSPLYKEREVEHQLADSKAETIITTDILYQIVGKVCQKTNLKTVITTNIEEYSNKTGYTCTETKIPNVYRFQDLLKNGTQTQQVIVNPDEDLAALQYTGGTTGTTKAAMLTHTNLVANTLMFAAWIKGVVLDEVFLTALPLSHIYGMTTSLNVPVALAGKMVLLPRFEPDKALDIIPRHRVTVFCGVPTMYQNLLAHPNLCKYDLSSLRICVSGASPLPPQVQKQFMQFTGGLLAEGYGLTEASPVTHCNPADQTLQTVKLGSIGLPLHGTEAKIVDAETGTQTLPAGETGELVVRGPQVMRGYWKNPQETAMALRDGWLYTGDIARTDEDGYFYLTDRKKDLIKHNGYSIYPREIEDTLYEHPAVKLCAVIGKPDPIAGETPKAYVVLKEGALTSAQELVAFVNPKFASYKALREVEFRKDLPLGPAGKILKRLLK
jgi:long-chain acyl-CoA synthetase